MVARKRNLCYRTLRIQSGVWLAEAVVSAGLFLLVAAGLAHLVIVSSHGTQSIRTDTTALFAAVQKLEQMRGLTWSYVLPGPVPRSDERSDLSVDPPGRGGRGLAPSPQGSLRNDVEGYVDYLDANGALLSASGQNAGGASYVRRWAIRRLGPPTRDVLACDVIVMAIAYADQIQGSMPHPADPGVVWLTMLKARR